MGKRLQYMSCYLPAPMSAVVEIRRLCFSQCQILFAAQTPQLASFPSLDESIQYDGLNVALTVTFKLLHASPFKAGSRRLVRWTEMRESSYLIVFQFGSHSPTVRVIAARCNTRLTLTGHLDRREAAIVGIDEVDFTRLSQHPEKLI